MNDTPSRSWWPTTTGRSAATSSCSSSPRATRPWRRPTAEALALIASEAPDAVLLDLKMPGRDGLDVLDELGPALADLPVIVITAFGGSAAAIEAMRRGAYDYLTKPFDLDEVLLTLKRALRQRGPGRRGPGAAGQGRRGRGRARPTRATTRSPSWSARARRCARSSRRSAAPRRPTSPS